MSGERPTPTSDEQVIACPKCNARLPFSRSHTPRIDACGFENYSFECKKCGAALGGIVDPDGETLLISERPS